MTKIGDVILYSNPIIRARIFTVQKVEGGLIWLTELSCVREGEYGYVNITDAYEKFFGEPLGPEVRFFTDKLSKEGARASPPTDRKSFYSVVINEELARVQPQLAVMQSFRELDHCEPGYRRQQAQDQTVEGCVSGIARP